MEDHRFDRFTRTMAGASSRRNVLKSLAASGAGGLGALVFGRASRAHAIAGPATPLAELDPDEQAIAFYEQLTGIAHQHAPEGCGTIGVLTKQFLADHDDIVAKIQANDSTRTRDQREAYVATYGDRLEEATRRGHFARERCRYADEAQAGTGTPAAGTPAARGGSEATLTRAMPLSFAVGMAAQVGIEAGCGGKGCADHCPLDTSECLQTYGLCAAGDDCQCCLSSLCGSKSFCMNDCTRNDCCSGVPACNGSVVPPPPIPDA